MNPQEKKKYILMSSVLGILLVLYIFVNDPFGFFEKGLGSGEKIFPDIAEEQVASIKIRRDKGAVVLVKKAAEWQVIGEQVAYQEEKNAGQPFAPLAKGWKSHNIYPANQKSVSHIVELVNGLAEEHIISRNKENFALYQVADNKFKASVQLMDNSGKELAAFVVGKRGDDFASQYYRPKGWDYVLVSSKPMGRHFSRSVEDWRDKKIFHFVANNIREYSYSTPFSKGEITLVKETKAPAKQDNKEQGPNKKGGLGNNTNKQMSNQWQIKEGQGQVADKKVQRILQRLAKLKAHGFLTEKESQKIENKNPAGRIVARNGTEHKLLVYGKLTELRPESDSANKQWIIRREGAAPFYLLQEHTLKRLSQPVAKLSPQNKTEDKTAN